MFLLLVTLKICLGWVGTAVSLRHLFCFITYHATSCMATSVNRRVVFSVVVLWNVSRLDSTLQLFPSVKMAYETPRIYHDLCHASRCMSMMCTLFLKIEYTLSLAQIFITNPTTCNTSLHNNNYAGDFQGHVIRLYNPFVVMNLLCLYTHSQRKLLLHIYQSLDILIILIQL
jgi:hypothetical protein